MKTYETKTDFVKNIRHDIKTPLCNLVGLAHIIKDLEKGTDKEELAADLAKASDCVQKLFNEMFQYAAITNNQFPINLEPICIEKIINSVSDMLLANAMEKHICLIKDIKKNIPICYSDPLRLRRIISNLLENSIKSTSFGKVMIRAETKQLSQHNLMLIITVIDTGIGKNDIKPVIAHKFVDDLGGKLTIQSEPHIGSVAACHIPVTLSETPFYTGGNHVV